MVEVNIEDIDVNSENSYFHFTKREYLESIEKNGLRAQIGDASELVKDKSRVCLSRGGKGILGIKNSFLFEFKNLRICDIPSGYRDYFNIEDFSSEEKIEIKDIYDAFEKRFKDEVYLLVDAREGEDFKSEDVYGSSSDFDIKGIENHDISKDKLKKVVSPNGSDTAFDIIKYMYNRILKNNPGKEELIKGFISDLSDMMDYIKQKESRNLINAAVNKGLDKINSSDIEEIGITIKNNIEKNMEEHLK